MPQKLKAHSEETVKKLREAVNYSNTADELHVSRDRAKRIVDAPSLEAAMELAKGSGNGNGQTKVKSLEEGGSIATLAAPRPAAVVFALGQTKIEVDPEPFYEAYQIYQDLRVRKVIEKDGFGQAIKDAMTIAWRLFVGEEPAVEMKEGNSNGGNDGQAQNGHTGDQREAAAVRRN